LKRAYAERMGKPENAVRFITADGTRIGDDDTADTVSFKAVRLNVKRLKCMYLHIPSSSLTQLFSSDWKIKMKLMQWWNNWEVIKHVLRR
jgi:hypothetical protein